MPKVTAFSAGRRNGNTEIFIKTALMALEKMGVEVELIRLNDCDLRPCIACNNRPCSKKGPQGCVIKDDGAWLTERFLESDGVIVGAPVWSLGPTGMVSVFRDRVFGPKFDMAGWELNGVPEWAHGIKRQRPGALISVGGAETRHWTSLGLATLYTTTFSAQTNVVDHMDVIAVAGEGEALLRKDLLLRARHLGENLGHAVLNPQKDWEKKYLGPDEGEACPGCHSSLVIARPGREYVECAICGRRGYVKLTDGKLGFDWPEDDQDRLTMMGKFDHMREIQRHATEVFAPRAGEIQEEQQRYRDWNACVSAPPSKQAGQRKNG